MTTSLDDARRNGRDPAHRAPPADLEAERALLGCLLVRPERLADVRVLVGPEDYYAPAHGHIHQALVALWAQGAGVDPLTVRDQLQSTIGSADMDQLRQLWHQGGSEWWRYAEVVARHAFARRSIGVAAEMAEASYTGNADRALEVARTYALETPAASLPTGYRRDGLRQLAEAAENPEPWVIPGLLRLDWRVVLVGIEGYGKSSILWQLATLAAHGIHPLHFRRIDPVRVLVVDCENTPAAQVENTSRITTQLAVQGLLDEDAVAVWSVPQGLDLRSVADRRAFEGVLRDCRPQLVCLGPAYKTYRRRTDSDEDAVRDLLDHLDSFRTRHRFALAIEHHGAKRQGDVRELEPYGTSLWLRWPELGFRLMPLTTDGKVAKTRTGRLGVWGWRGDRLPCDWPEDIRRGSMSDQYPWHGWSSGGYPSEPF